MDPNVSIPEVTEPPVEPTVEETKEVPVATNQDTTEVQVKEKTEKDEGRQEEHEQGNRERERRRDSRGRDGERDRKGKERGRESKSEKERDRERDRERNRDREREREREKRRGDLKDERERERKRSRTDTEKRGKGEDRKKDHRGRDKSEKSREREPEKRDRRVGDDKKKEKGGRESEIREKHDPVIDGVKEGDGNVPVDVVTKTEEKEAVKEELVTHETIEYLLSLPPESLTPYQVDMLLQHMEGGGRRESVDVKKDEGETAATEMKEVKQEAGEGDGVEEGPDGKEKKEKEGDLDVKKEKDDRKDRERGRSSGKDREKEKERERERARERERRERRDRDRRRERSEERERNRRVDRERELDFERARLGAGYRDVRDRDGRSGPQGASALLSDRLLSDSSLLSRDLLLGASRRLSPLTERLIERERAALLLNDPLRGDPLRGDPLLAGRGGSREDDWLRERLLLEEELRRPTFGSGLGADPLRFGSYGSDILRVLARERDSLAGDPLGRDPLGRDPIWRDRDPLGRDRLMSSGRYIDMDTRRGLPSPRTYDDRGRDRADAIFSYDDITGGYDAVLRRRLEVEEELMRRGAPRLSREESMALDPRDYLDARDLGRDPRDLRESRDMGRDSRDVRDARDLGRDPRDVWDARDLGRDPRDLRDMGRDPRDAHDMVRDPRDLRDARDLRDVRDMARDVRDARDMACDPRDVRDARDMGRDRRDVRDARDGPPPREFDPLRDMCEEEIMQRRAEMAREGRSMGGDITKVKKIRDWLGVDPVADPEKYEIALSERTIYVGNLPITYNPDKDRDGIYRAFGQFGEVVDVRDRHGSRFLFLTFREASQANLALDLCKQGVEFNGSHLLIRTAHTGSQSKARRK